MRHAKASEFQRILDQAVEETWSQLEPKLAKVYASELRKLGREAARQFLRHHGDGAVTAAGEPDWHLPHPDEIVNSIQASSELAKRTHQIRQQVAQTAIGGVLARYGLAFNLSDPIVQNALGQMGQHITRIVEGQRQIIMESLQESYDEGLSIRNAARAMVDRTSVDSLVRGSMIARTELTGATTGAGLAAAQAVTDASPAGTGMLKGWLSAGDDKVRDAHVDADAEYADSPIPLDQPFLVGGEPMMHPGDPGGSPENVINCRCTVVYTQEPGADLPVTASATNSLQTGLPVRQRASRVRSSPRRRTPMTRKANTVAIRAALEAGADAAEAIRIGFAVPTDAPEDEQPSGELDGKVSLAIEMGDPADPMMQSLAEVADTIDHCADYGECYWNADTGDVWWEACDGDLAAQAEGSTPEETNATGTSREDVTSRFMAVEGVQSVTIEAETPPPDDGSYVQVPQTDVAEGEGDGADGADTGAPPAAAAASDVPAGEVDADGFRVLNPYTTSDAPGPETMAEDGEASVEEPVAPPDAVEAVGKAFRSTLAIEGVPTDDGRVIVKGALTWRELPMTLMAIIEDSHGGMPTTKTVVAGRIDQVERVDTGEDTAEIIGTGVFDTGEYGAEIARLVDEKMMRGVSIDMAPKKVEEVWGEEAEEQGGIEDPFFGDVFLQRVLEGVILGATVCPFAAFGDADIETITASAKAGRLPKWRVTPTAWTSEGSVRRLALLGEFQPVVVDDVPPAPGGATGGGMIALYPDPGEAQTIADPDGNVPADALHVTLVHFDTMPDPDTLGQLVDEFATGYGALSGMVCGAGVFGSEEAGTEGEPAEANEDEAAEDEQAEGDAAPAADADVPQVLLIDAPGLGELRFDLTDVLEGAGIAYSETHDFTPHITVDYDDPADFELDQALIGTPVTFAALSIVTDDGTRADVPLTQSMTASAAGLVPVAPPLAWFDYPTEADGEHLVPLTVTKEGRVYGHVAVFNECHIGGQGRCITAPHHYRAAEGSDLCAVCGEREKISRHSRSGYDYFHLGEIETAEGELVRVGQITVSGPHADTTSGMSAKRVQAHYDNTATAAADVHLYEDSVGVMCAGALRPDMPAAKVRELRASKPSGDWRPVRGRLELMAVLGVNMPGYPVPRRVTQLDEETERDLALVAAGVPDEAMAGEPVCSDDLTSEINELVARARLPMLIRRAKR